MSDSQKKIKIVYLMTSCRKCGPTWQTLNIIKNLDRDIFEPILVTIYNERGDSQLESFVPYVAKHSRILMSKKDILLGRIAKMRDFLNRERPDIIHSVGVFPDYLVDKTGFKNHVFTLRNYAYEDYLDKFGKIRGLILAKMQLAAIKNTKVVATCSKSLEKMYKEKLGIVTRCIQNGVDTKKYTSVTSAKKKELRKKLGFPDDEFLWIFTGQFIGRKNIPFMIDSFLAGAEENDKLVLLGDGDDFKEIYEQYCGCKNVVFVGNVDNVVDYLNIGDVYISASKSEGLPNSVLEAMACGLPVLLSNIPQHEELLPDGVDSGGLTFVLDDRNDFIKKMKKMRSSDVSLMGQMAKKNVDENFEASVMSRKYQSVYSEMMKDRVTLFISGLSGGGAERVTCNLANYLEKIGYLVDVLTMSNKRDTYRLNDGVNRICLLDESERAGKIHDFCLRQRRLKEYIKTNQDVSCYITMLPVTSFMLLRLKKFTNSKMIVSERVNPDSYGFVHRKMMIYAAKKSDGMVVQTKEIAKFYKRLVRNIVVIPNALNEGILAVCDVKKEKKIVAAGRLSKQKNYPMLIEAFGKFSRKCPDYILEIYGEGDQKQDITRMVKMYGLSEKVCLCGYVDNLPEKVASATCFAMTSDYEGMSNALIEAMCLGVPCVATDCDGGGAREIIKDGVNGFLVEKGAVEMFATRLEELALDAKLGKRISDEAAKLKKTLSYDKIYSRWVEFIRQIEGQ